MSLALPSPGLTSEKASLDDYLSGAGNAPWIWGQLDCTLFAANWAEVAIGRNPAQSLKGRYCTRSGAHRFILEAGGLIPLASELMAASGFPEAQEAAHGDIALVTAPVLINNRVCSRPVSAIRYASWWLVRGEDGIHGGDFPLLKAWRIW